MTVEWLRLVMTEDRKSRMVLLYTAELELIRWKDDRRIVVKESIGVEEQC